jgi:hypothetical protein
MRDLARNTLAFAGVLVDAVLERLTRHAIPQPPTHRGQR